MDIYWYGQACFKLKGKNATVIIDPFDPEMIGLKLPKDLSCDLALITHDHPDHNNFKAIQGKPLRIDAPGEYEAKGVAVSAIQVYHDNKKGQERGKNLVYSIDIDGVKIVHVGDLGHIFTQEQLESIGTCDILLVPVGGAYTINGNEAAEVVTQLEPKIVIPMHFGMEGLKVLLDPATGFLKEMGVENLEPLPKLSATKEKLPEELQVVLLAKQ